MSELDETDSAPFGTLRPFVGQRRGRINFGVDVAMPDPLEPVERLLAGAAVADITPPPGMPKAGYSSNAHDGIGFRTRLRARVTHLRSGVSSIAIVQCDLLGGSSVVQHLVAEAIAERTDIPLSGLMIGATHTHAGPGQFSGTDFYNKFASNRGGFDPAWTQFLVDQISSAVISAYETRQPAVAAIGSIDVWGSTRNRSLEPYVNNDTVTDKRNEPQRKFASIDPALHLLRVDTDPGLDTKTGTAALREPLSAAVIFGVHGTGVSVQAHEYNADLWAYLVDELGHRIETSRGTRGVVGAMEGTHADMAPALYPGRAGHIEAKRIGRQIGSAAADLYDSMDADLVGDVALGCAFREIDLRGGASINGITLPDQPAVGASLVAGAKENLTPVVHLLPPFRAGFPKPFNTSGPHGHKWVIGSKWLQPRFIPLESFPRLLPIQALRIGPSIIVGMPFEVTVESGRRMVRAIDEVIENLHIDDFDHAIVSSVANEYCGYVATAEEYKRQYYEGGHTLYGPNTEPFLSAHAADLVAALAAAPAELPVVLDVASRRTWSLRVRRYLAEVDPSTIGRSPLGKAIYVDTTGDEDGYWEFRWRDAAIGALNWHQPLVLVEENDGSGWRQAVHRGRRVDDQGCDVEVAALGRDKIGHVYAARWHDPAFGAGLQHRFVLLRNAGGARLISPPFD